jgi:hypothetical protein
MPGGGIHGIDGRRSTEVRSSQAHHGARSMMPEGMVAPGSSGEIQCQTLEGLCVPWLDQDMGREAARGV